MFKKLLALYKISQQPKVRILKALLFSLITLAFLVFFVDSPWLNTHILLSPALSSLPMFQTLASLLGSLLGLHLIQDATKLALLSILIFWFLVISSLALFSWFFYVLGFSYFGGQLWRIWVNYHQGKDVLWSYPFSREPLIQRRWSPEEKIEICKNLLETLCQRYQCPPTIMDESLFLDIQSLETKPSIEHLVKEQFHLNYEKYHETLSQTSSSPKNTSTAAETFNVLYQFCAEHYILVAVAGALLIGGIIWYGSGTPPPVTPKDLADSLEAGKSVDLPGNQNANLVAEQNEKILKELQGLTAKTATLEERISELQGLTTANGVAFKKLQDTVGSMDYDLQGFEEWKNQEAEPSLNSLKVCEERLKILWDLIGDVATQLPSKK